MKPDKFFAAEIVDMQKTDINQVLGILTESQLEFWGYEDFFSELQRFDSIAIVAKEKAEIIGFCVARLIIPRNSVPNSDADSLSIKQSVVARDFDAECEIYNLAVKREFRSRGIGSRILNKLTTLIHKCNCRSIWLEVRCSNGSAIKLYKKNGFRQAYIRKKFYSNPLEDAIVMQRDLYPTYFSVE